MKEFNLEKALNGHPLITRNGKPAYDFRFDKDLASIDSRYQYRAIIDNEEYIFTSSGQQFDKKRNALDLFLIDTNISNVDWEQRRYEVAKDILSSKISTCSKTFISTDKDWRERIVQNSIILADELIKQLKN